MKKLTNYILPKKITPEMEKRVSDFEKFLESMDTEDAHRIVSMMVSNVMERQAGDRGEKHTRSANNRNKILFNEYGQYHWEGGDHSGYYTKRGKVESYTMEPYYIWKQTLKELITWTDHAGLDFYISGESPHFPGRTVMIRLMKRIVDK